MNQSTLDARWVNVALASRVRRLRLPSYFFNVIAAALFCQRLSRDWPCSIAKNVHEIALLWQSVSNCFPFDTRQRLPGEVDAGIEGQGRVQVVDGHLQPAHAL